MRASRQSAKLFDAGSDCVCGYVKAAAASGLVPFILARGADADLVLGEAGLNERLFDHPEADIPLARYVAMMEAAALRTGDSLFGLRFGLQFPPAAHGPIGQLALAAPSIGAGLRAFMDFFPLHQNDTETALVNEAGRLRMEYRILDARIWNRRQDAELTIGMLANLLRHASDGELTIEEICFEHPAGEHRRDYERMLGAPVFFSARTNAITLRGRGLTRPMPRADSRKFVALAEQLRAGMRNARHAGIQSAVCSEIRRLLPEGYPSVEQVAENLGLARWTLQRRLARHEITFSQCVELVRARLATLYLAQSPLSIGDVSDLLGYSEISAFSRAFRRWHGTAPEHFRKVQKAARPQQNEIDEA